MWRLALAATAAVLLVVGGAALSSPPDDPGFAGSDACVDCHPDLHDRWSGTGHARTLAEAGPRSLPDVMVTGGTVPHPPGRSVFRREGGRFLVDTVGASGAVETFPITHVVGVRRIRMFLTRLPDGRLQVLPAMLEEPTGEWFDYSHLIFGGPGADPQTAPVIRPGEPSHWTGMPRFFDARCARCHTTGFESLEPGPDGTGPRSRWTAAGVSCESCHGPAKAHVLYHERDADGPDPILRTKKLPRLRQVSVCLRCHMEADVAETGFRPGDDFFERHAPTLLEDVARVDAAGRPLELIYDGLPFLASECAREGGLTCASCHDPHGSPYRSQLRTHPKDPALCADCHGGVVKEGRAHTRHDPAREGASCTGCHMTPISIERGHGVVTDHTVGVPDPTNAGLRTARDACTSCHSGSDGSPGGVPLLSGAKIRKAYREWWPDAPGKPSWEETLRRARGDRPGIPGDLAAIAMDRNLPRVVRASAARLLGGRDEAGRKVLLRLAADEDVLLRSSAMTGLTRERGDEADAVLMKGLFDEAAPVRYAAGRAAIAGWRRVRENRSLLDALISELREQAEAVPEDDRRWFLLGAACQIAGLLEESVAAYERKLALDPYAANIRRTVGELRAEIDRRER